MAIKPLDDWSLEYGRIHGEAPRDDGSLRYILISEIEIIDGVPYDEGGLPKVGSVVKTRSGSFYKLGQPKKIQVQRFGR